MNVVIASAFFSFKTLKLFFQLLKNGGKIRIQNYSIVFSFAKSGLVVSILAEGKELKDPITVYGEVPKPTKEVAGKCEVIEEDMF